MELTQHGAYGGLVDAGNGMNFYQFKSFEVVLCNGAAHHLPPNYFAGWFVKEFYKHSLHSYFLNRFAREGYGPVLEADIYGRGHDTIRVFALTAWGKRREVY